MFGWIKRLIGTPRVIVWLPDNGPFMKITTDRWPIDREMGEAILLASDAVDCNFAILPAGYTVEAIQPPKDLDDQPGDAGQALVQTAIDAYRRHREAVTVPEPVGSPIVPGPFVGPTPIDEEQASALVQAGIDAYERHKAGALLRPSAAMALWESEAAALADTCMLPPPGWKCTREAGHNGPCAAVPVEGPTNGR